jgi:hypothetical protein
VEGLLQELRSTEDSLGKDRVRNQQEVMKQHKRISELTAALESAEERLKEHSHKSDSDKSDFDYRRMQMQSEVESAQKSVERANERIAELEAQKQADRATLMKLRETEARLQSELDATQTELHLEQGQRQRVQARFTALKNDIKKSATAGSAGTDRDDASAASTASTAPSRVTRAPVAVSTTGYARSPDRSMGQAGSPSSQQSGRANSGSLGPTATSTYIKLDEEKGKESGAAARRRSLAAVVAQSAHEDDMLMRGASQPPPPASGEDDEVAAHLARVAARRVADDDILAQEAIPNAFTDSLSQSRSSPGKTSVGYSASAAEAATAADAKPYGWMPDARKESRNILDVSSASASEEELEAQRYSEAVRDRVTARLSAKMGQSVNAAVAGDTDGATTARGLVEEKRRLIQSHSSSDMLASALAETDPVGPGRRVAPGVVPSSAGSDGGLDIGTASADVSDSIQKTQEFLQKRMAAREARRAATAGGSEGSMKKSGGVVGSTSGTGKSASSSGGGGGGGGVSSVQHSPVRRGQLELAPDDPGEEMDVTGAGVLGESAQQPNAARDALLFGLGPPSLLPAGPPSPAEVADLAYEENFAEMLSAQMGKPPPKPVGAGVGASGSKARGGAAPGPPKRASRFSYARSGQAGGMSAKVVAAQDRLQLPRISSAECKDPK